jgi:hypothetical protein
VTLERESGVLVGRAEDVYRVVIATRSEHIVVEPIDVVDLLCGASAAMLTVITARV